VIRASGRQEAGTPDAPARGGCVAGTPAVGSRRWRIEGIRIYLICLMLVSSQVPWRTGEYFSGGVDAVVAAKAVLVVAALMLALLAPAPVIPRPVGVRSLVVVLCFATCSALGGWATGTLVSSVILSVRVLLLAVTLLLVHRAYPLEKSLRALCVVSGLIGVVVALSGAGSLLSRGRLYGGILPLNPNLIALLIGVPCMVLVWRVLQRHSRAYEPYLVAALLAITWLTGSRAGLLALVLAFVVMFLQARRLPVTVVLLAIAAVPVVAYVTLSTDLVAGYFARGGDHNLTTLNSRTIAWSSAFTMKTGFWQHWFGAGYATKTVAVSGTYWDTQVLDSSWVSAFVQGGVVGFALLTVWSVATLVAAFRCPQPWRMLASALVVYCLVRSFVMSGLLGSEVLFVVFLLLSLSVERGSRPALDAAEDDLRLARGQVPAESATISK